MNAGPRVVLLAVTVLLPSAKAPAAVYHLKETLAELSAAAMVSGDGKAETAIGRRKGEKALRLEHKSHLRRWPDEERSTKCGELT